VSEFVFFGFCSLVGLLLQSTTMGLFMPADYKPDLFLILVFWAGIRTTFINAAGFAFAAGLIMDLFSGAPIGLFATIYCIIFISCGYLHAVFQMDGLAARAITVLGATVVSGCIVLLARRLAGTIDLDWNFVQWVLLKALTTGLLSLVAIPLLDRLWNGYSQFVGVRIDG